ncbi:MAG: outer membrane protein assembly factor BamB, partial [Rhodothermales bacterium]
YGPLSGAEGTPGFTEAEGNNAYMGDFSRVDKRQKTLATNFGTLFSRRGSHDSERGWYAPLSTPLVDKNRLLVGSTLGPNTSYDLTLDEQLKKPNEELYWTPGAALGYVPEAVLYGGLVLRSGVDGKLYCISADNGATLWSVSLGERLASSPIVIGEDIFIANETGKVFQLDIANGSIMKESTVGAGVFGHPATDGETIYVITEKSELVALDRHTLDRRWASAVAAFTDSTPAVDNGMVYLGDQRGTAYAIKASSGAVVWKSELADEFSRCPVVTANHVVLGCRGGTLAVLDRKTGKVLWKKTVASRFSYEPMVFENELLYFEDTQAMIAKLSDGTSRRLQWNGRKRPWDQREKLALHDFVLKDDPISSLGYYKGRIFVFPRHSDSSHNKYQVNYQWHLVHGSWEMLIPEDQLWKPEDEAKK